MSDKMVKLDDVKEILDLINERNCYYDFSDCYEELSLRIKEKISLLYNINKKEFKVGDMCEHTWYSKNRIIKKKKMGCLYMNYRRLICIIAKSV